jgi:DNA helicase II / ATP-dependent DNA helicase PcrA
MYSCGMSAVASPPLVADPFENLNDQQRDAVVHGSDGDARALLVIAGAGSGKTMTLAARVAHLIQRGADPHRLLLLTFSRRAAGEMVQRAGRIVHQALRLPATTRPPSLPWAGTFHAIGARLLRDYAPTIGLPADFTVLDRADAEDLMALVRQAQGLAATKLRFPQKATCLAIYSRVVNSQGTVDGVLREAFPWCLGWETELAQLFAAYAQAKAQQHSLDFDDLLLYWSALMEAPELSGHVAARFDHVLVDEYQDTNRLQAAILRGLQPDGRGLTVVGDDAQSIYAFRAAEVRNILDFPLQFPQPARVVALERNYRSTQPILEASNAVIAEAPERYAKTLWCDRPSSARPRIVTVPDEMAQARQVADRVLAWREEGIRLKQQAVLFRTAHHSAAVELELTRRRIPFVKFGGLKFLESTHVKDVLAVLRWAENPRGRLAGFRVAQLVPGVGPANARKLLDAMEASATPGEVLLEHAMPAAAREDWAGFAALWTRLRETPGWPADLDAVNAWYLPLLQRLHEDAPARQADLAQLAQIAAGYAARERFLTELTLDPPAASSDEAGPPHLDEDYMILSTIHSAKGQEWGAVQILNVVDGCIPSEMSTGDAKQIAEERRLLYVGMTRAKQHLELLAPQRFFVTEQARHGDRHVYASLSRFITDKAGACFERVSAQRPPGAEGAPGAAAVPDVRIDLAARVRDRWGG